MLGAILVLTFFVRVAIQLRETGETGLIGLRPGAGPVEALSGVSFIGGIVMGALSAYLVAQGDLGTIDALESDTIQAAGVVIASVAGLAVFLAQLGMGASWRIGVSDDQGTDLVTSGWFAIVRNPIYTSMIAGWIGFALMVPTWLAIAAIIATAVGLEMQVRLVEEPYLLRAHGNSFRAYASRVGRFVPGIGRLG